MKRVLAHILVAIFSAGAGAGWMYYWFWKVLKEPYKPHIKHYKYAPCWCGKKHWKKKESKPPAVPPKPKSFVRQMRNDF